MTGRIDLVVRGDGVEEGAQALEEVLSAFEADVAIERTQLEDLSEEARKAVDPISLAALIVSIPAAVLAVWDIADRIDKRRRAKQLIEAAERLQADREIATYVVCAGGHRALKDMSPDELLDLAGSPDAPRQS